jgi:hypothetical protein
VGLPEDASEAQAKELVRQTDVTGMMHTLNEQLPEE